jgi:hypothetical protein
LRSQSWSIYIRWQMFHEVDDDCPKFTIQVRSNGIGSTSKHSSARVQGCTSVYENTVAHQGHVLNARTFEKDALEWIPIGRFGTIHPHHAENILTFQWLLSPTYRAHFSRWKSKAMNGGDVNGEQERCEIEARLERPYSSTS